MSFSYQTLRTAIINLTEDDSTELSDYLDTAIALAEDRIHRDLDSYGFIKHYETSVSVADPFVSKPDNALVIKSLSVEVSGEQIELRQRTNEFIREYWPIRTSVGVPKYFAEWTADTIILAPTPASAYPLEIEAAVRLDALTSASATNWISLQAPRPLLYATMAEVERFHKNNDVAKEWDARYSESIQGMINEARRVRRTDYEEPHSQSTENNLLPRLK